MRFDIDTYKEIADSLLRNKSRSLLTGFGIFWGLFMLLFLIGGGKGVKGMLVKNFEGFASNAVILVSQNTSLPYKGLPEGRYWNPETVDIQRLKNMVPELETVTGQISAWGQRAAYEGQSSNITIKGVDTEYMKIEAPKLKYGRYINKVDVLQERKVCVIGKRIYQELFPEGGDPCGKFIQIGSVFFQVIGVDYSSGNLSINGNATTCAIIPISLSQKLYSRGKNVDIICCTAKPGVRVSDLSERILSIFAHQHNFDPKDDQALMQLNTQEIFTMMDSLFRGVNFLIWLVGLGTLLAGAIGVSNIMMVTVKERTTEIGIRRAIGATPKDILSQIISESISLTIMAGTAGIVFSILLLRLLEMIVNDQAVFQISFWTAVAAALLLTVMGAAAGLAPALRAMKIKPVDAMRDE